jgi:hypothetical protein
MNIAITSLEINTHSHETSQASKLRTLILEDLFRLGKRLSNIHVEVEGTHVTLRGVVRSYYDRQLCVSGCRRVSNFIEINDQLEVINQSDVSSGSMN